MIHRAVGRSENPGVPVHNNVGGGHNLPFLVELGLTDLPQSSECAMAPPIPTGHIGLLVYYITIE